jgi:hypothetical protein
VSPHHPVGFSSGPPAVREGFGYPYPVDAAAVQLEYASYPSLVRHPGLQARMQYDASFPTGAPPQQAMMSASRPMPHGPQSGMMARQVFALPEQNVPDTEQAMLQQQQQAFMGARDSSLSTTSSMAYGGGRLALSGPGDATPMTPELQHMFEQLTLQRLHGSVPGEE